jgi:hypothetical protein
MHKTFELNFKYTEKEFRSAMLQSHNDSKRILIDLFLTFALFVFGIYLLIIDVYNNYF